MYHTSDKNLSSIITFNRCSSFEELKLKNVIHLNLCDLNGYINISDFSHNALELFITCEHPDLRQFENYYGNDSETKIKEQIQKLNCRVDLDAGYAGNFAQWGFKNNYEHHFINSITLRHPNQVWCFGNNPFRVKSDYLYKMFKNAKIAARDRNIENYLKNLDGENLFSFSECLKSLQIYHGTIKALNEKNLRLFAIIDQLKSEIEKNKHAIENTEQNISNEIYKINQHNITSKKPINISDISKIKLDTNKDDYDPGSEQNFTYEYLSKSALNQMRQENAKWYNELSQQLVNTK